MLQRVSSMGQPCSAGGCGLLQLLAAGDRPPPSGRLAAGGAPPPTQPPPTQPPPPQPPAAAPAPAAAAPSAGAKRQREGAHGRGAFVAALASFLNADEARAKRPSLRKACEEGVLVGKNGKAVCVETLRGPASSWTFGSSRGARRTSR